MTDPITIVRDDGSPLTLSRAEVVRAMAAMRAADALGPYRRPSRPRARSYAYTCDWCGLCPCGCGVSDG